MNRYRQALSDCKTTLYRRPKDELQRLTRWGPRAYFRCNAWAREMEAAAWQLAEVRGRESGVGSRESGDGRRESGVGSRESEGGGRDGIPVELWFLTGRRFWYQTAFCAWTFARHSGREVVLNLVDDGTLEPLHEDGLRRIFPNGVTLRKESVRGRIDALLPVERFPILRQRWVDYINIRKLTDVHLGSNGVKLVLDSDMLFFRRPDALLEWWDEAVAQGGGREETESSIQNSKFKIQNRESAIQHPNLSPCLMTDCSESYGYSRELMEELTGAPIPPLLNVGICGLRSEDLGWERLEHWCRALVEREGTNYYLEQALVAMLAGGAPPTVMPRTDYITFPTQREIAHPTAVLQHYVADSKPGYFGSAWKSALLR